MSTVENHQGGHANSEETHLQPLATGPDLGFCQLCQGPGAKQWHTPEGVATLCPACAVMNDIGCP